MFNKTFLLTLVAGLIAVGLVGCSDNASPAKPAAVESSSDKGKSVKETPKSDDPKTARKTTDADVKTTDAKTEPAGNDNPAEPGKGGWGAVTGRFVLEGLAPTPVVIAVTKDIEICGKDNLVDESLVVAKDGGIANVVIWVSTKKVAEKPLPDKAQEMKFVLDNKGCRFEPHVLAMRAGQPFGVHNSDPVGHNSNLTFSVNQAVNVIVAPNDTETVSADQPETVPVPVACNIHPWMKGYLVVRPNSLFAISGTDGKFEMKDVPTGELEFQVWQEKSGYISAAKMGDKSQKWTRGKFTYQVKPDRNDLGDIVVSADLFNK